MPFMYLALAAILCAGFELHIGFFIGSLICFVIDWVIASHADDDASPEARA